MKVGVGALQLQGTATQLIRQLDTPEKCAQFWVEAQEPYEAVAEVMAHARSMLMLEVRDRTIQVGDSFVSAEPTQYSYAIAAVKELAPECVTLKEIPTSDKMQRVHELAGAFLEAALASVDVIGPVSCAVLRGWAEALVKLSQPEIVEAVDANKLRGILGRGDARAQALIARGVKTPVSWKLVVKEGANARSDR